MKAVLILILALASGTSALAQDLSPDTFGATEPYQTYPDDYGLAAPGEDAPPAEPGQDPAAPPPGDGDVVQPEAQQPAVRVKQPVAVFSGIDKITGRIHSFDVYIDETVQFGALQVTPRVCYTSGATDAPRTDGFVEVDEITLDRHIRRIFNGWMFADSPGLNAVEHPIYDVWLKDCKSQSDVPPPASAATSAGG